MGVCKKGINVINVAAKTINLAKEPLKKRPIRPKVDPDCHGRVCPIPPPPPATQIRVCTPEQLRSICPPEPCVCPEVPIPPTGGERLFAVIMLLSKWLFLLGFIKWTDDLGIWGNTESTAQLRSDAYKRLSPALRSKSQCGEDGSKDGDSGSDYGFTYNAATMWNNAINNVFYVVAVLPAAACSKVFGVVSKKCPDQPPPPPPQDAKTADKKKVTFFH